MVATASPPVKQGQDGRGAQVRAAAVECGAADPCVPGRASRAARSGRAAHAGDSETMKLLFDLFPILLFFSAFKLADIYVATGVAIAATVLQIAWLKLRGRAVEPMQWASLGIIVVFGGMTLLFHDETFIKWKPTVLYGLFAAAMLLAPRLTGKNPLRAIMGSQLALPPRIWQQLTWAWAGFFAAMGALNLFVAYRFPLETWVDFKVFGTLGLTVVFVIVQAVWIGRYAEEPETGDAGR
jgi:intracellular septation protein